MPLSAVRRMIPITHRMQLPREVLIGSGTLQEIGETARRLGFEGKALLITGPSTFEIAGKAVIEDLTREGFLTDHLIVESSSIESVSQARAAISKAKPDVVLGVGGGKNIDIAKLSSALENVQFVSVPTSASHDGLSSGFASIRDSGRPTSVEAQSPVAIIADIDIISKSPRRFIASGCGDILAKYTAVRDWKLAHKLRNEYYGEYAASLALMSSKLVIKNADTIAGGLEEGLRTLLEALISCGVAASIAGSSRPCSGAEHMFSHALDTLNSGQAMHGEQCGVGAIMMAYLQGADWRLIRDTLRIIGAPTKACELNVPDSAIVEALTLANKIRPERYTILGEKGLANEAAMRLARATGVIDH